MKVGIAALNSSNYKSIGRALNWIEIEYIFIKNSKELNKISHLILPGVSSFGSVINELIDRDLIGGIEKLKNLGIDNRIDNYDDILQLIKEKKVSSDIYIPRHFFLKH